MVPLVGVVGVGELGMPVIVVQELNQELRGEMLRRKKELEEVNLPRQAPRGFQRTPCEIDIVGSLHDPLGILYILRQGVLRDPVAVLGHPLGGILLVACDAESLSHRGPPLMAVELPAQLVVLYGPVLPVYILAIKVHGVAVVDVELVLHPVVGPLLLCFREGYVFHIHPDAFHPPAALVIVEQGR